MKIHVCYLSSHHQCTMAFHMPNILKKCGNTPEDFFSPILQMGKVKQIERFTQSLQKGCGIARNN